MRAKFITVLLIAAAVAFGAVEESYWVKKKPASDTLTVRRVSIASEPDPQNWERLTISQINAYEAAEKAAGWVPVPVIETPPVPSAVSRRQLKEQLIVEGLDETIAAILAAMPGTEGKVARNWYAEAIEFERGHPLVAALAAVIWPSPTHTDAFRSAQLDRIWTAAAAR